LPVGVISAIRLWRASREHVAGLALALVTLSGALLILFQSTPSVRCTWVVLIFHVLR